VPYNRSSKEMDRMKKTARKLWTGFLLGLALVVAQTGAAQATNKACFDWSCNDTTYVCSFNSACTTLTNGQLWRYRWDFGDGAGYYFTSSSTVNNTYSSSLPYPTVTLTVIPLDTDPFSVTCEIVVYNNIGPPRPTYGRCQ
jgi:PKD domain